MDKIVALLALCLVACNAPIEVSKIEKPEESYPPFCTYDLAQPAISGSLKGYFGPNGIDCVPPEYGAQIALGFGFGNGDYFKIYFDRSDRSFQTMHGRINGIHCSEWSGEAEAISDLPRWSIFLDMTCQENKSLRVAGQFSGNDWL